MPIDASSDPYDTNPGFDPAGAKFDRPDIAKEFEDDADGADDGGDDSPGVATSKVDPDEIDEDLGRAGSGATRVAAIDLDDVQKDVPGDLGTKADFGADDDVDLEAAGSGSGLKGALLADGTDDGFDKFTDDADGPDVDDADETDLGDFDKGVAVKADHLGLDDGLDADDSLKSAFDDVDDDDGFDKFDDDADDPDDVDHQVDKGDFLGFH